MTMSIIITLLYSSTIEQFLIQPFPGYTRFSILMHQALVRIAFSDQAIIFSKKIICLFLHLGCTATHPYSGSCCNFLPEKCGENEGDCDSDADCKNGLACGIDNCPAWGNLHPEADCCFNVTGITIS